ncbi:hypothetical protein JKF63_02027 [Porcisia hertigi]|uniref:Centrosomal protein of 19 kDa n=1 Tax=Porcisia hertigi TaxID=2761500 RepID=A0A836L557_9TRYP|nr:hypothetical protein JKF63_02027 [Porcisia hertigi]
MAADDMGAELWALVHHLFQKYHHSPQKAVQELAVRTHAEWYSEPGQPLPRVAPDITQSRWYQDMCSRYASVMGDLRAKHQRDIADVRELVSSLYPEGCNVSEYAEALRTSVTVFPCLVSSDYIDHLVQKRGAEFDEKGLHEVSGKELVSDVIEGLLIKTLTPRQWWCREQNSVVRVTKTGIRSNPPTLYIEYERPAGVPHVRSIHLSANLRPGMPTAQLARRLASTHEAFLSEAQFQSLLIRCQRLLEQSAVAATLHSTTGSLTPTFTAAPPPTMMDAPSPSTHTARKGEPQKADLSLLYRNPDAALENVDLNDADDITLREFKEVMNERFNANVVKPGDPGYVYDKRVEVSKPVQSSEWDDDSD